jgi:hypothetical protein
LTDVVDVDPVWKDFHFWTIGDGVETHQCPEGLTGSPLHGSPMEDPVEDSNLELRETILLLGDR